MSNLIPAYLTYSDGTFANELAFDPGDVRVAIDDGVLGDALGTMQSLDRGLWVYAATAAELAGDRVTLVIEQTGLRPFAVTMECPFQTDVNVGEVGFSVPIFIEDNDGDPVTGLTTSSFAGVAFVVNNNGAFGTFGGTFSESGGGLYFYHPTSGEIVVGLGALFVSLYDAPDIAAWYVGPAAIAPTPPVPVPVPVVYGDPDYVDQIAIMFDHLCDQFQPKDD